MLANPELRVAVPSLVAPNLKTTVPVGIPPYWGATAAVRVTVPPTATGLGVAVTVVVVVATVMPWLTTDDVLPVKPLPPLYFAVIDFVPTVKVEVLNWATPPVRVTVPNDAAPFLK